ncbi:MAG: hypothetical protein ACKVRP_06010 [Bacteroidota bacterium]
MIKVTTTKATYKGIEIRVISENRGRGNGNSYSCTNNSGRPKSSETWFATQREAIANERQEIDAVLQ